MSQHIIRQQIVEIDSSDKEIAQDVFSETSKLFNNRLRDETERLFNKYAGEGKILKLNTVQLDLGTFSFPFSEENLAKVYREKLEEALASAIKEQNEHIDFEGGGQKSIQLSIAQLLEQFLLTGTISWWANTEELKNPDRALKLFSESNQKLFQDTIFRLMRVKEVRKRIAFSFEEDSVITVVKTIEPTVGNFIVNYHNEVSNLHSKANFITTENRTFKKELWLFILDFLNDQFGSQFNKKSFVKSTIRSIANKYNLSYSLVLHYLEEGLRVVPNFINGTENLFSIIQEIAIENVRENNNVNGNIEKIITVDSEFENEKNPGFFFLINGYLPVNSNGITKYDIDSVLIKEIQGNISSTRNFFEKFGKLEYVRKRLILNFSESAIKAVVEAFEPSGAATIISYTDYTSKFQKETNFVKTEEKNFRQSLWELVLSYLFSELGSVFNAKMFLISNITSLARHYNIEYRKLLAILVQGIGQTLKTSSNQPEIFYLLTEILAENREISAEGNADYKELNMSIFDENINNLDFLVDDKLVSSGFNFQNQANRNQFALSLMLYILEFGNLPWWIDEGKYSVEFILKQLKVNFADEFRTSLLYAAKKGSVGISFFENYSEYLFTELIYDFYDSTLLKDLYYFTTEVSQIHLSGNFKDLLFGKSIIEAIKFSNGNKIDTNAFLEKLLYELINTCSLSISAIKAKEIVFELDSLRNIQLMFNNITYGYSSNLIIESKLFSLQNFQMLLEQNAQKNGFNSISKMLEELPYWILDYLISGKLNAGFFSSKFLPDWELVSWATEFLFRTNKEGLINLLNLPELNLKLKMKLLDLISKSGITSEVSILIEQQIQQNLKLSSSQKFNTNNPKDWKKAISEINQFEQHREFWETILKLNESRKIAVIFLTNDSLNILLDKFNKPSLKKLFSDFREAFLINDMDYFERELFNNWIKEYFLFILTGPFDDYSVKFHIKQFSKFIFNKTIVLDRKLINHLTVSEARNDETTIHQINELRSIAIEQLRLLQENNESRKELEDKFNESVSLFNKSIAGKNEMAQDELLNDIFNQNNAEQKSNVISEGEQIYISNAGMVLLHPFISTLFSRAGLTQAGKFVDEENQSKAAMLLQYAAMGSVSNKEYELVLNKLLVGLNPEEVLNTDIKITLEDKELVDGMINAIMQQWDKMKNTSLEGFRNSFLIREGFISYKDDSWVLRVEQRAYDIILQTLPWSFGMVKFSWMNKPLIVEWT
jgi:hypothetical protein